MISFVNDYQEAAHPRVLAALAALAGKRFSGYGEDSECAEASALIRRECGAPDAGVHFIPGGTLANLTLIGAALRPSHGVVCASSGHINAHETGAIESTGHKVIALPSKDGKLTATQISDCAKAYRADENFEHIVRPAMAYISDPTELGTVYTLAELRDISQACRENRMKLYIDGARLACALDASDITLRDLAELSDAFYIGGAKHGCLFGEALVITDPDIDEEFRSAQKQRGALTSKSFAMGAQFNELFRDGLYYEIGRQENRLARRLADGFAELGFCFLAPAKTNQVFPIMPDELLAALSDRFAWSFWEKAGDGSSAVRFCTGFSTTESDIDSLLAAVRAESDRLAVH